MKKITLFLLIFTTFCAYSFPAEEKLTREVPFQVGEKLTYNIKIWGVTVGQVNSTIVEKTEIDGREVYHVVVLIRSTGVAARVYRLYDELHSYIDTKTLGLLKAERFLQEGGIKSHVVIDLDPDSKTGTFYRQTDGRPTVNNRIKIMPLTLDATSLTYYVRGNGLDTTRDFELSVLYEDRVKMVEVSRMPDEEVKLKKFGRFTAQVFKQIKGGDTILWLSNDSRKLPVKILALSVRIVGWRIVDILGYLSEVEN